ncbi:putative phytanoyldioxygenase family protein [Phaeomoniella chlamydospora]|uniref:Putative phytanoyldioxygenase family protein n=1 Tax=Phaeomoniella chlamydospora TaxID=158046 RepID=A0A0G2EK25_PHACM|nr:putative phytanoyldioxygenase family protein [Phaeomoniella chlamydospora]
MSVNNVEETKPTKVWDNANIAPPAIRYDDVHISFDRIQDAHAKKWPPRRRYQIPEYTKKSDPNDVVDGLKKVGGVIVRGILSTESIDKMEKDMRPHLDADLPWEADNGFFPPSTRRAFGLIGKSGTAALDLIGNELYQAVCDQFLTSKAYKWYGNRSELNISPPQVNNTIVFSVRPGDSFDQPLHRDDDIHYGNRQRVDQYPEPPNSREFGIGFFVAGTRTTKANGATRFIPGSHLEATERPPNEADAVYAELNPGDGFIMLSSCYHGGSKNTTKDEERLVFSCFMTRGYLRQEENQYLAAPLEVAKTLPLRIQKLMGYTVSEPMLGWVEFKDPRVVLDPNTARVAHTE